MTVRKYMRQDILADTMVDAVHHQADLFGYHIMTALVQFEQEAMRQGDKLNWDTLAISTRWDGLAQGTLLSSRVDGLYEAGNAPDVG